MRWIAVFFIWLALGCGAAGAQEQVKGWLGAELSDVTQEEAAKLGWEAPRGAKVVKPVEGSPAAAAGLRPGDIAVTLDGVDVENIAEFLAAIGGKAPGTAVKLRLLRGGKEKTVGVTLAASPAEPKTAAESPLPMLDTGGHMALIKGIAFTPDGRQLVSASNDKTIRVWDLASGKTVRTIRGESAPGQTGRISAMALSPDGKWLVVGGRFSPANSVKDDDVGAIRLYEFASGKLVALLKGHASRVFGLAFSLDGSRLISGSFDHTAIIWDTGIRAGALGTEPKLLHRLEGHKDEIYAVGFSPDGSRAVTGSDDHDLRLWRADDGKEIARMTGHGDRVRSLAVAPDGTIASGDYAGEIRLWDADGRFLRMLAKQRRGVGSSLSFSPGGKLLLSGAAEGSGGHDCHVYDVASGKEIVTYTGHDNIVLATAFSPDGRWAATGGGDNEEIHLWDPHSGKPRPGPDGKPLRLAGQGQTVWAAGFSADGRRIGWGHVDGGVNRGPLAQALALPLGQGALGAPVALGEAEAGAFRRAQASFSGFSLSHRKGGAYGLDAILDILKDGRAVASITRDTTNGYDHRSYSFTPDGETVVSGGANGFLTAYDRAGNKLGDFVGHEGDVYAAAVSPDGRFLVSGAADQTVRLWNLKTRELLVTLFRGADGEWVMFSPQGYFAASPAGAALIGWQINHGPEHEADYVTAAQLRKSLNRPDIVAKAIQLASAEEAVKQSAGTNFTLSDLLARPVPRFRIVSPVANSSLTGGAARLEIALEGTPDPVNLIRFYVNGVQVDARQPEDGPGFKPGPLAVTVPLANGRNVIRAVAVNETGETSAEVAVDLSGEGVLDKRGTLRILAIGVDKYPHIPGKDLTVAGADAKAFAETMATRLGGLHQSVASTVLVNGGKDGEPNASNIVNALDELRSARPNDTILVFVSGHGFHEDQDYYFVPTDAEFAGSRLRKSNAVLWAQFQSVLESAKGRRFLFLDTCRSGNRYSQRLTNEAHEQNIVVYAAARWDQDALELPSLGGGLFTYALVEGVKGKAKDGAGEVRAESLRDYVRARVAELAKPLGGDQEPQFVKGRDADNYLLARGE